MHTFKIEKPSDGQVIVIAIDQDEPGANKKAIAVCPSWEWAARIERGLVLLQRQDAERNRAQAAAQRKRRLAGPRRTR